MQQIGYWILISFGLYYLLALISGADSKNKVLACLIVGCILSLGIVLAFLS